MSRADLGKIGVWTSYGPPSIDRADETARLVEHLGYGT
jgi:hypothetical protein